MKDVVEGKGDISAVIEFGLSKRNLKNVNEKDYRIENTRVDIQSKMAGKFINWLHKIKKKSLREIDFENDVFPYLKETVYDKQGNPKKGGQTTLAGLGKFFEYIDGRFVPNGVGLRLQKSLDYKDFNRLIKERNIQVDVKDLDNVKFLDLTEKEIIEKYAGVRT